MSKKIYLAGSCSSEDRTRMVKIAKYLRGFCEVYCPFELKISDAWNMSQESWARKVFEVDKAAIEDCDIMIVISVGRESTAGTNWEQGYAYGIGKPVYVFQVTDKPTSLMSYWGCSIFRNIVDDEILDVIEGAIKYGDDPAFPNHIYCKTVLT